MTRASDRSQIADKAPADPLDEMIYVLLWLAKRRLDGLPAARGELDRPAEFISARTGVAAPIVRGLVDFLDDPYKWNRDEADVPMLAAWLAHCRGY